MKPFETVPTPADFSRALMAFDAAIASEPPEKRQCWHYWPLFHAAAEVADNVGDLGLVAANALFDVLCFGALCENSSDKPLGAAIVAIGQEHYDALQNIFSTVSDAELRARVADVLWLVRGNFRAANEARDAYLVSAQLLNTVLWGHGVNRLVRAMRIERGLGITNGPALHAIKSELLQHASGDSTFCSAFLMEVLLEMKLGDGRVYAPLAEAAARVAENEDDPVWHRAERYWDLAAQWWKSARDDVGRQGALAALAESHVRQADAILARPDQIMPHSHAAHWIEQAIHTLRDIGTPATRSRAEELHRRLLLVQSRIAAEMPGWADSVDVSEDAAEAQRRVCGRPFIEAIAVLASLHNPSHLRAICRASRRIARSVPLSFIASQVIIGPTGGTTAREIHRSNDKRTQKRERRRVRMIQYAHQIQGLTAQCPILPALRAINDEHRIHASALMPMLSRCAFVPPGHERLFAEGIVAGAHDDWIVVAHLLVPQVEAGLRSLLIDLGATPPLEARQGQCEWGMQEFLFDADCINRLAPVFGEALIYDVRVLLVEKFGGNLRPNIAHGLLPQGVFGSFSVFDVVYLWWLILRLCWATLHYQATLVQDSMVETPSDD